MKHKTKIERVYNEDTGWFETREVELNSYSFTDDDRIMIVREYMEWAPSRRNHQEILYKQSYSAIFLDGWISS